MRGNIVVMTRAVLLVMVVAVAGRFMELPGTGAILQGGLPGIAVAAAAEGPDLDIEVDLDREADSWYRNPVWIAIFVLGALIIIVLIIMAARGGGTAPPRA